MSKIVSRYSFLLILIGILFASCELHAQAGNPYIRIINTFEKWKLDQFRKGNYATEKNCNRDTVLKDGYKGSEMGIPSDINISFTDINNDNVIDGLILFYPDQCDGGNALMNAQIRVLVLSTKSGYIIDDTLIDKVEGRLKKGWLNIERAEYGTFCGNYFEYKESDGRCCPSIKRPIIIDFKTKKLTFEE